MSDRAEERVYLCDRCEGECGAGIADRGDTACSVCGQHVAPHAYVPASRLEAVEAERDRLADALERLNIVVSYQQDELDAAKARADRAEEALREARAALPTSLSPLTVEAGKGGVEHALVVIEAALHRPEPPVELPPCKECGALRGAACESWCTSNRGC